MNGAVIVEKLAKTYNIKQRKGLFKSEAKSVEALKGISLEIKPGEIFGLLGPNGAGKTTIINIIGGLVLKTSGEVSVLGHDVVRDSRFTRRHIGVVQQEINTDIFFSVWETAVTQAGLYGIGKPEKRVEEILKSLQLWDKREQLGRKLSGGMKRRVMIAKALVHDPEILFLDEPTAGVDVELRANLWRLIREMKAQGKTVILTTHYLEEAEMLADRIGIIDQGKIVLVEDKQALMARYGTNLQEIYLKLVHPQKEQ